MKNSSSRIKWGFAVAGAVFGLVLPVLLRFFYGIIPSEFYYSDSHLLQNLGLILMYAATVSSYAYVAVFICSVVYDKAVTALLVFASMAVYGVGSAVYSFNAMSGSIAGNALDFWLSAAASIILVPAAWFGVTKLISLIKMPAAAKVLISALPAFLIYNFSSIISAVRHPDKAAEEASSLLVPLVIFFVTALFIYIITNDIITRPKASGGASGKGGAEAAAKEPKSE